MKVLHWVLNAALLAAAVALFALAASFPDKAAGLIVTGVAFLAAAILFCVQTVKGRWV